MGSNLPPGVTESMIPGNRPEDMAWDTFIEWIEDDCTKLGFTVEDCRSIWRAGRSAFLEISHLFDQKDSG